MERLPCPGPAELNNSGAENENSYPTAPEAAWLCHLVLARNAVIEQLTPGVTELNKHERPWTWTRERSVIFKNSHRWMVVFTNGAATWHELDPSTLSKC